MSFIGETKIRVAAIVIATIAIVVAACSVVASRIMISADSSMIEDGIGAIDVSFADDDSNMGSRSLDVYDVSWQNSTVGHITAILPTSGTVRVPLASGTYYYYGLYGNRIEVTIDPGTPPIEVQYNADWTYGDIESSLVIRAYDELGNERSDLFQVVECDHISNVTDGAEVQINGFFKIADIDDASSYFFQNDPTLMQERLNHHVSYAVEVSKEIEVNTGYYDQDGQPVTVTVPLILSSGKVNYWDNNLCAAANYDNPGLDAGGVPNLVAAYNNSGIDTSLITSAGGSNDIVALEITSVFEDEQGNRIILPNNSSEQVNVDIFKFAGDSYAAQDQLDELATMSMTVDDVGALDSSYIQDHSKQITINSSSIGIIYDYNVTPGLWQVRLTDVPQTLLAEDGAVYTYQHTVFTSERPYAYYNASDNFLIHDGNSDGNDRTVPGVLGEYTLDNTYSNDLLTVYMEHVYATIPSVPTSTFTFYKADWNIYEPEPLSGAVFGLYDDQGQLIDTATSQADGSVSFDVPTPQSGTATFTVRELSAPAGYAIYSAADMPIFTLRADSTDVVVYDTKPEISGCYDLLDEGDSIRLYNTPLNILVEKLEEDSGHAIDGATTFTLYSDAGCTQVYKTATSPEYSNTAVFENVPAKDNAHYWMLETVAPPGYELSTVKYEIAFDENVGTMTVVGTDMVSGDATYSRVYYIADLAYSGWITDHERAIWVYDKPLSSLTVTKSLDPTGEALDAGEDPQFVVLVDIPEQQIDSSNIYIVGANGECPHKRVSNEWHGDYCIGAGNWNCCGEDDIVFRTCLDCGKIQVIRVESVCEACGEMESSWDAHLGKWYEQDVHPFTTNTSGEPTGYEDSLNDPADNQDMIVSYVSGSQELYGETVNGYTAITAKLGVGESIVVDGLPAGTAYYVNELVVDEGVLDYDLILERYGGLNADPYYGSPTDPDAPAWVAVTIPDSNDPLTGNVASGGSIVNVLNKKEIESTGSLVVRKDVEGSGADLNDEFQFKIRFADSNGTAVVPDGITNLQNGWYYFTLKGGESVTFADLPAGTTYEIVEVDANSYPYTLMGDAIRTGEIEADIVKEELYLNKWAKVDKKVRRVISGVNTQFTDSVSAYAGSTVEYQIKFNLCDYLVAPESEDLDNWYPELEVYDYWDEYLSIDGYDVLVYLDGQLLTRDTDYTIWHAVGDTYFTIYCEEDLLRSVFTAEYDGNGAVTILYRADVDEATTYNELSNRVSVSSSDDIEREDTVEIYAWSLGLMKVSVTNEPIYPANGAMFKIYDADDIDDFVEQNPLYTNAWNVMFDDSILDDIDAVQVVELDGVPYADLTNLSSPGRYYIIEVQAPDGYQRLDDGTYFEVSIPTIELQDLFFESTIIRHTLQGDYEKYYGNVNGRPYILIRNEELSTTTFRFAKIGDPEDYLPSHNAADVSFLEDAYFELYESYEDADNGENAIDTAMSGPDGIVEFDLPAQSATYYLCETEAPLDYWCDPSIFKVVVSENAGVCTFTIYWTDDFGQTWHVKDDVVVMSATETLPAMLNMQDLLPLPELGDLTVVKTIHYHDRTPVTQDELNVFMNWFDFTVTFTLPPEVPDDTYAGLTFVDGQAQDTFQMMPEPSNEYCPSQSYYGLPEGTTYTVTENNVPGCYEVNYIDATGTIVANDEVTAGVDNNYLSSGTAQIPVKKILTGRAMTAGEFTFRISGYGNAPMPVRTTITNNADGTTSGFGPIVLTEPGDFTYTVSEDNAGQIIDGVAYDQDAHTIVVIVEDNGTGSLVATYTVDGGTSSATCDEIVFRNVYSETEMPMTGLTQMKFFKIGAAVILGLSLVCYLVSRRQPTHRERNKK